MSRKTANPQNRSAATRRVYVPRPIITTKPYNSELYSSFIFRDLADDITTFTRSAVALSPVTITNVTPIASYSWVEASTLTIAVPGSPRFWYTDPRSVPIDSGNFFVDHNAFYMRSMSPLIPLFAAIDDMHPSFNYKQFDFITDSNNLHKLLCWAVGASYDFRIDVDVRSSTCLFTRSEGWNTTTIRHSVEHRREYQKAATRVARGCEKATGHYRMISIDVGGLKILLRSAVGACISPANEADDETDSRQASSSLEISSASVSKMSRGQKSRAIPVQGVSIAHTTPRKLLPQASTIEIQTCASHKELNWAQLFPRLYLSQTASLYIAKHHRGNFDPPEKVKLDAEGMQPYVRHAEQGMAKLKIVLQNILDAVKKEDRSVGLSLVCKNGQLTLYRRQEGTGKVLGKAITSKFK